MCLKYPPMNFALLPECRADSPSCEWSQLRVRLNRAQTGPPLQADSLAGRAVQGQRLPCAGTRPSILSASIRPLVLSCHFQAVVIRPLQCVDVFQAYSVPPNASVHCAGAFHGRLAGRANERVPLSDSFSQGLTHVQQMVIIRAYTATCGWLLETTLWMCAIWPAQKGCPDEHRIFKGIFPSKIFHLPSYSNLSECLGTLFLCKPFCCK